MSGPSAQQAAPAEPPAVEPSEGGREFLDFLVTLVWESRLRRLREKNDNTP